MHSTAKYFEMKKVYRWVSYIVVALAIWYLLMNDVPIKLEGAIREVVKIVQKSFPFFFSSFFKLPLYALICFGGYSAAVISYNLVSFNDCEDAAKSLEEVCYLFKPTNQMLQ
jgi:hypothetical protein